MPMYEYFCSSCMGRVVEWRKIADMDHLPTCAECGWTMVRLISRPQLITRPTRLQDANRFNEVFYPGMTEAQIAEERKREDAEYEANWANTILPERRNEKPDEMTLLDLPMTDQAADKETIKWLEGS